MKTPAYVCKICNSKIMKERSKNFGTADSTCRSLTYISLRQGVCWNCYNYTTGMIRKFYGGTTDSVTDWWSCFHLIVM